MNRVLATIAIATAVQALACSADNDGDTRGDMGGAGGSATGEDAIGGAGSGGEGPAGGGGMEGAVEMDPKCAAILALTPDAATGAALYAGVPACSGCHGEMGEGVAIYATQPVSLSLVTKNECELLLTIVNGSATNPLMPPFGASLMDQAIADIFAHMKTLPAPAQ